MNIAVWQNHSNDSVEVLSYGSCHSVIYKVKRGRGVGLQLEHIPSRLAPGSLRRLLGSQGRGVGRVGSTHVQALKSWSAELESDANTQILNHLAMLQPPWPWTRALL